MRLRILHLHLPTAVLLAASPALAQQPAEVRVPLNDSVAVFADIHTTGTDLTRPVILLFHQAGSDARGEYGPIIPRLTGEGYHVIAADIRGGGTRFGTNRAGTAGEGYPYCVALEDVAAIITMARARGFSGKLVLWGSSYSAALVIVTAARRTADVAAVLAFSPAWGGPMRGCEPEEYASQLSRANVPLLVLRPAPEMELEPIRSRTEQFREAGAQVFVAANGAHGSSMLVESRVQGDTGPQWGAVLTFLRTSLQTRAQDKAR